MFDINVYFYGLEQATGIEPAARPWEGRVLPLYDACNFSILSFLRLKIKKTLDNFLNRLIRTT